jgi:hypothetical protein
MRCGGFSPVIVTKGKKAIEAAGKSTRRKEVRQHGAEEELGRIWCPLGRSWNGGSVLRQVGLGEVVAVPDSDRDRET